MMNKEVMFSSKTDMWETPQCFFDALNAEFGFTCDVCALPENAKCEKYFTPDQDGLLQEWTGVCWCNPPYGRQIGKWVQKAAQSKCTVVMLLPARTDTRWYHEWMQLTEMFNICETCVYAPCICGNEPENCIAYVQKNGGDDDAAD